MPVIVPASGRGKTALPWIIRGAGALMASCFGLGLLILVPLFIIAQFHRADLSGLPLVVIAVVSVVLMSAVFGLFAKAGYDMYRKLDVNVVKNFSFVSAYIIACAFYFSLPTQLPKFITDNLWSPLAEMGPPDGGYRHLWAFAVFLLFYNLTKAYAMRTLDLNPRPPTPRRNPSDPDPFAPEYPQKSPLIQL